MNEDTDLDVIKFETKKQRLAREREEQRLEERQEYLEKRKLEKIKTRVKWLSKITRAQEYDLEDYILDAIRNDELNPTDFLRKLIARGAVKINKLIEIMDEEDIFYNIDRAVEDAAGDAHEEWWNGQAREEGFW